jgi:hypothetical protein
VIWEGKEEDWRPAKSVGVPDDATPLSELDEDMLVIVLHSKISYMHRLAQIGIKLAEADPLSAPKGIDMSGGVSAVLTWMIHKSPILEPLKSELKKRFHVSIFTLLKIVDGVECVEIRLGLIRREGVKEGE